MNKLVQIGIILSLLAENLYAFSPSLEEGIQENSSALTSILPRKIFPSVCDICSFITLSTTTLISGALTIVNRESIWVDANNLDIKNSTDVESITKSGITNIALAVFCLSFAHTLKKGVKMARLQKIQKDS